MARAATSLVLLLALGAGPLAAGSSPKTASGRIGAVSSSAAEASEAGAQILRDGGNAMDAAVTTALVLAVVYPPAGNLTGGGFLVYRSPLGETHALDFRETAPSAAWEGTFLGPKGEARREASLRGGLAVAVPGTLRGLEEAHRRFGRLPWKRLVAPAISWARSGFVVTAGLARDLREERKVLERHGSTRRLWFRGGEPLREGDRVVQEDLARTLESVAEGGADALHTGPLAGRLAAFVRSIGGVLTERDLAGYRPEWRAPAVLDHEGFTLVSMPLPSSGGGFLLPAILEQLRHAPGRPADSGARAMHILAEAERRAYADRNRWLGDPACRDVPLGALLHPARLAALGAGIDPNRATASDLFPAPLQERAETTHLSVGTSDGAAVALTYTLNGSFGNGVVVPGIGVFLNNEMDDFTTAPGRPNLFGLVQGDSNSVRAGARPLSSMTPLIVLKDGRPRWVLGSPGGATIPTTVLQVFVNLALGGLSLPAAIAAPRFHHQHLPDELFVERHGFPESVLEALRERGHRIRVKERLGEVNAVAFEANGRILAVADPRGYGRPAAAPPPNPTAR